MSLRLSTFSAGRWTATSALVRSGFQISQTVVLARLLAPADFGLMAVTASLLAVLSLFTDVGLSRAIIHFENISAPALSSLYWLNLLVGATLSISLAALAPILGNVFRLEGLATVLLVTSPVFLLSAAGQQFRALAEKEFRFSALAVNEITSTIVGFSVAVSVGLGGGGVFALVAATLATAATDSALAWWRLSANYRPKWHLRGGETRPFLRFGGYLVGESLINTLVRQSDVFIAGLNVSSSALGMYSLPRDLSMRVGMIVNPVITRVGFPVMARLQGDIGALKSVYLRTLNMTASVNFPVYVALALFADEAVALLYGPQWKGASVYLQVLAAWGLVRSTGNPVGSLLHATGAVKGAFFWNVLLLAILPPLYWVAAHGWGLRGLASSLVAVHVGLVLPGWFFLVRPACGAAIGEYLGQLATPLLLSLTAGSAAWLSTRGVPHGTLRLAAGCLIGGVSYVWLSWMFNRVWTDAMWTLLRLPKRTELK